MRPASRGNGPEPELLTHRELDYDEDLNDDPDLYDDDVVWHRVPSIRQGCRARRGQGHVVALGWAVDELARGAPSRTGRGQFR